MLLSLRVELLANAFALLHDLLLLFQEAASQTGLAAAESTILLLHAPATSSDNANKILLLPSLGCSQRSAGLAKSTTSLASLASSPTLAKCTTALTLRNAGISANVSPKLALAPAASATRTYFFSSPSPRLAGSTVYTSSSVTTHLLAGLSPEFSVFSVGFGHAFHLLQAPLCFASLTSELT